MSEYREQAIRDVAEKFGCDAATLAAQMEINPKHLWNNGEFKVYAVTQRESVLKLEAIVRGIANADQSTWEPEYRSAEEFRAWAKNICKHALKEASDGK